MRPKRAAIRVDSSFQMGSGHIMRCATLALQLIDSGFEICFFSRPLEGNFLAALADQPFSICRLPETAPGKYGDESLGTLAHREWLGLPQSQDFAQFQSAAQAMGWSHFDLLIIDHYGLDVHWERLAMPMATQTMVIDDLADREHLCDILLDQNFFSAAATRYAGLAPSSTRLLLGPQFALLRKEFAEHREKNGLREIKAHPRRLLVNFGGSDPQGLTLRSLRALETQSTALKIDVVVGLSCKERCEIQAICQENGWALHVQTHKMQELMAEADIALGAGGSTVWERCCMGLPSLVYAFAENQRPLAMEADKAGLLRWLGNAEDFSAERLLSELERISTDLDYRVKMAQKAQSTVDGRGTKRVVREVLGNRDH